MLLCGSQFVTSGGGGFRDFRHRVNHRAGRPAHIKGKQMSFVTTQPEALSASAGTLWGKAANVPPSLPGGLPRTAGAGAPQAPAPRYGRIPTVMAPPPS